MRSSEPPKAIAPDQTAARPGNGRYGSEGDEVAVAPCVALRPSERAAFEKNGFVILRGLIPPEECRRFLWQVRSCHGQDQEVAGQACDGCSRVT